MKYLLLPLLVSLFATPCFAATLDGENPIVETKAGKISGLSSGQLDIFKGIPYAEAPVNDLRFKQAQPKEPWPGVYKAEKFGNACPQIETPLAPVNAPQSEDCLYLNIWKKKGVKKAPVMVWLHGGALVKGAASTPVYDGSNLANDGDLIVVSPNYRISTFGGFFPLDNIPQLKGKYHTNTGLGDVMAALRWIKENIENFGGDPENITLFGQSSGGLLIAALYALPESRELFNKVIIQSFPDKRRQIKYNKNYSADILKAAGLTPENAEKFLELTSEQVVSASPKDRYGAPLGTYFVIGGDILKKDILNYLQEIPPTKPMLIGYTLDEGEVFVDDGSKGTDVGDAMAAAYTKCIYADPADEYASIAAKTAPVYKYRFDYAPDYYKKNHMGAFHTAEIPYIFKTLDKVPNPAVYKGCEEEAKAVSDKMHNAWINFAKNGDPGWQSYSKSGYVEIFDK